MSDENTPTPSAPTGTPPSGGSQQPLTMADIQKLINEQNAKFEAEKKALEERLEKQAKDHSEHIKRLSKKDQQDPPKSSEPAIAPEEIEGLRQQNAELKRRMDEADREKRDALIDKALTAAVAKANIRPEAQPWVRDAIKGRLAIDSTGQVVVRDGKADTPLDTHFANVIANDAFLQAPVNRGGGGRPNPTAPSTVNTGSKPRSVTQADINAGKVSIEDLASGKAVMAQDED